MLLHWVLLLRVRSHRRQVRLMEECSVSAAEKRGLKLVRWLLLARVGEGLRAGGAAAAAAGVVVRRRVRRALPSW